MSQPPPGHVASVLMPGMIHELRHPLLGIKAGLQLLEKSLAPAVSGHEDWLLVQSQVRRLENLLLDYQEFLDPGSVQLRTFDIAPVIAQALGLLQYRTRTMGMRFSIELSPSKLMVHATPGCLVHVVSNLVLNALDALEAGGSVEGRLMVWARSIDGATEIRVSDSGPGIAPEVAARIFEPRFSTKAPGKGSGLGLSLARLLAERAGGSLVLCAAGDRLPWARTELCLTLPAAPSVTPVPIEAPRWGRARVLIVDDQEVVTSLFRRALRATDLELVFAADGDQAAALLREQSFELLLTDKNLPGQSGIELIRLARARSPNIGIVLMTAYPTADSARQAVELGADDLVDKPFELHVMIDRLRRVLEARRSGTAK